MKNRDGRFYILQFLISIGLSIAIKGTVLKTIVLCLFWLLSFWPISLNELVFFVVVNIVFVFSNYGALKSGAFQFTKRDILLMPYNELFMWGFYFLNCQKGLRQKVLSARRPRALLLYVFFFASAFTLIHGELALAVITLILLLGGLYHFHEKQDLCAVAWFLFMGTVVEGSGLWANLWHYPNAEFAPFALWTPLMWANLGLIESRLGPRVMAWTAKWTPFNKA